MGQKDRGGFPGAVCLSDLDMFHSIFVRCGPSQDTVPIRKQTLTCSCLCISEQVSDSHPNDQDLASPSTPFLPGPPVIYRNPSCRGL